MTKKLAESEPEKKEENTSGLDVQQESLLKKRKQDDFK